MSKLSQRELRTSLALSGVIGLRMFGLFLIMPVFTAYALHVPGATPFLVGLAIGVYGFVQVLLQVPAGLLSDRLGRHLTITLGLMVFIVGSVMASLAQDITGMIMGRMLQGMGVVSGSIQALAADHSRAENRSKVMGIIGVSIGLALILAIILAAPLAVIAGLSGLFGLSALLALMAIILLWAVVPRPEKLRARTTVAGGQLLRMLVKPPLLVPNVSIFMIHVMLTSAFVALPLMLVRQTGLALNQQWQFYLPVLILSGLVMGGVLRQGTSVAGSMRLILLCATGLGLGLCGFSVAGSYRVLLWLTAVVFFSAFNLLEASLPGLVSRLAPPHRRGAALGAYAASQFLGAGVGGVIGGLVLEHLGLSAVFLVAAVLILVWLPFLWWGRASVLAATCW